MVWPSRRCSSLLLLALSIAAAGRAPAVWMDLCMQGANTNATAILRVQNQAGVPVRLVGCSGFEVAAGENATLPLVGLSRIWVAPTNATIDCYAGPFDDLFDFVADFTGSEAAASIGYGLAHEARKGRGEGRGRRTGHGKSTLLNALTVKLERLPPDHLTKNRALFREFKAVQAPIFLIVNGFGNFPKEKGNLTDEGKEEKEELEKEGHRFGQLIAERTGVSVARIIVAAERDDFETLRAQLGPMLAGTSQRSSRMKTYAQVRKEFVACISRKSRLALELQKREENVREAEQNMVSDAAAEVRVTATLELAKAKTAWASVSKDKDRLAKDFQKAFAMLTSLQTALRT